MVMIYVLIGFDILMKIALHDCHSGPIVHILGGIFDQTIKSIVLTKLLIQTPLSNISEQLHMDIQDAKMLCRLSNLN